MTIIVYSSACIFNGGKKLLHEREQFLIATSHNAIKTLSYQNDSLMTVL